MYEGDSMRFHQMEPNKSSFRLSLLSSYTKTSNRLIPFLRIIWILDLENEVFILSNIDKGAFL